ncbi:hypothetical protein GW626_16610 [Peribacillus muralis]|uniref:DUF4871 domain-containing protein n=1 Tax=Peribacillus muralis TaxID=264697 RepID=UPI001F4DDB9C|nr:DUF4871 domain-containing protein [Peribacillus muralis]MCK1991973.1 DUF4871 domain-containing protein [Peribacillus muralis]MCK2012531.1 DUF4871 domain-containing protein [Peribacillus muralis]
MKAKNAVLFMLLPIYLTIPTEADAEIGFAADYEALHAAPTFTITEKVEDVMMLHVIRGMDRKFGFMDKPLLVDKEIGLEWLFWRDGDSVPLGELEVTATHAGSGITATAKGEVINIKTPIKELPQAYTPQPVSFKSGGNDAPVSMATTIFTFTETGIWDLQIFVQGQFMGDMKVSVTEKKKPLIDLNKYQHYPYVMI